MKPYSKIGLCMIVLLGFCMLSYRDHTPFVNDSVSEFFNDTLRVDTVKNHLKYYWNNKLYLKEEVAKEQVVRLKVYDL